MIENGDGPTNGVMKEEDKDSMVQILCPGLIATSESIYSSKGMVCWSKSKYEFSLKNNWK